MPRRNDVYAFALVWWLLGATVWLVEVTFVLVAYGVRVVWALAVPQRPRQQDARPPYTGPLPIRGRANGAAFEDRCAAILRGQGWQVRRVGASGDQGADLIAFRDGIRIAIQCKDWRGVVGNAAVQQALAGSLHYGATHAAVVTDAGYTSSARLLAASTRVALLTTDNLFDLTSRLDRR